MMNYVGFRVKYDDVNILQRIVVVKRKLVKDWKASWAQCPSDDGLFKGGSFTTPPPVELEYK